MISGMTGLESRSVAWHGVAVVLMFVVCCAEPAWAAFADCAISWDAFSNNPGFISDYTYLGQRIADEEATETGDSSKGASPNPASTDLASGGTTSSNPGTETTPFFGYFNGGTVYDPANPGTMEDDVIFFRMRVAGDPTFKGAFVSEHWNILVDVDADGYKEYWIDLEGDYQQSGSTTTDRLNILYSDTNRQDIPDPDASRIDALSANAGEDGNASCVGSGFCSGDPTVACTSTGTECADASAGSCWLSPGVSHTRAIPVSDVNPADTSGDWYIDFQVPMTDFNDGRGNQVVYPDSPVAFVFSTSASNTDPLQKDWMMDISYGSDLNLEDPIRFGDIIYPNGQPVVGFTDAQLALTAYYTVEGNIYVMLSDRGGGTSPSVPTIQPKRAAVMPSAPGPAAWGRPR